MDIMEQLRKLSPRESAGDFFGDQRPKRPRLDHNATPPRFQETDLTEMIQYGATPNMDTFVDHGPRNSTFIPNTSGPDVLEFGESTLKNQTESTIVSSNEETKETEGTITENADGMIIENEKGDPMYRPQNEGNDDSNGSKGSNNSTPKLVIATDDK